MTPPAYLRSCPFRPFAFLLALVSALGTTSPATAAPAPGAGAAHPFLLEALVDFPDDATAASRALTPQDIDAMMAQLGELGIRRVSWIYYGDGHGGFLIPAGYANAQETWKYFSATWRLLGNPLQVAVAAGHRHGLEVYAYYKPYETGPDMMYPEGTEQAREGGVLDCLGGKLAWMDPFVRAHPELRIKRRTDDIPAWAATATVCSIRLTKRDAAPTRVTAEHLQIWTSPNNFHYQRSPAKFTFAESVEPAPRDARDHYGNLVMRRGDPVRVLTLGGLKLDDKYIMVTTDFTTGTADKAAAVEPLHAIYDAHFFPDANAGDFANSGLAIMTALDGQGREIPGSFANGGTVWCDELSDFRQAGLMFDYGWGAATMALDAPNTNGKKGVIGFTRGRNAYLPGALCETEPQVQEFWLKCLDEMIAAGVDGVDFREENHSTHTDHPEDYGFNPAVLAKAQARPGDLLQNIANVRGEAYTDFLRECHRRLAKAGKPMRYNLQLDFFRPNPPPNRLLAYPANIHFEWQRWIDEGLLDGSILRFFSLPLDAVFEDGIAREMIARSQQRGLPITVNRYVDTPAEKLSDEVQRVKSDGRFSGFILYEVSNYIKFGPNPGECVLYYPPVVKATHDAR